MEYALIKNGVVVNVIVADEAFVKMITSDWDHIEKMDSPNGAGIGWGWEGTFVAPPVKDEVV